MKKDCCCKPSVQGVAHSPESKASVPQGKAPSDNFSIKWEEKGDKSTILSKWMWLSKHGETQPPSTIAQGGWVLPLAVTNKAAVSSYHWKIHSTSVRGIFKEKLQIFHACTSLKHSWRKIREEACNVTLIYATVKSCVVKSSWVINHIYHWQH